MSRIFNAKYATFLAHADKFITNLPLSKSPTFLGIALEEQDQAKALHTRLSNAIIACDDAQLLAKQTTLARDADKKALDEVLQSMRGRVKLHPDFTPAIGAALGLESTSTAKSINLNDSFPTFTATDKGGGKAEIRYPRYNSDGINCYCKREGDADWILVGRGTVSPLIDIRPLLDPSKPELRRYCAVYVKKDQEIGQFSAEVEITCAP